MEAMNVFPHSKEQIYEMFDMAVSQECLWTNHITNNSVLGISDVSTEQYTKYLANVRLKSIGLEPLYEGFTKNPYKHLDKFASPEGKGGMDKPNFFEASNANYVISSAVSGWSNF
jgi:ribonucleoside-diphosphate reductase beta chain